MSNLESARPHLPWPALKASVGLQRVVGIDSGRALALKGRVFARAIDDDRCARHPEHVLSLHLQPLREAWTVIFADELASPQRHAGKQAEAAVARRHKAECIQPICSSRQVHRRGASSFLLQLHMADILWLVAAAGQRARCGKVAYLVIAAQSLLLPRAGREPRVRCRAAGAGARPRRTQG
eukprot:4712542-Prymnesium_polylepis.1